METFDIRDVRSLHILNQPTTCSDSTTLQESWEVMLTLAPKLSFSVFRISKFFLGKRRSLVGRGIGLSRFGGVQRALLLVGSILGLADLFSVLADSFVPANHLKVAEVYKKQDISLVDVGRHLELLSKTKLQNTENGVAGPGLAG